jgi:hypothetical protein
MSKHVVGKDMIDGFVAKTRLFGCASRGLNPKSIDMLTDAVKKRVWYVVNDSGGGVYAGPDLDEAIEIYNNL